MFLSEAPAGFELVLGELPEPVSLRRVDPPFDGEVGAQPDIVLLFVQSVAALRDRFEHVAPRFKPMRPSGWRGPGGRPALRPT